MPGSDRNLGAVERDAHHPEAHVPVVRDVGELEAGDGAPLGWIEDLADHGAHPTRWPLRCSNGPATFDRRTLGPWEARNERAAGCLDQIGTSGRLNATRTIPRRTCRWYVMSVSSKPGTELHWDGSKISLTMGRTLRDGLSDAQTARRPLIVVRSDHGRPGMSELQDAWIRSEPRGG